MAAINNTPYFGFGSDCLAKLVGTVVLNGCIYAILRCIAAQVYRTTTLMHKYFLCLQAYPRR